MGVVRQRQWVLTAIVFAFVQSCFARDESSTKMPESKPDERPIRVLTGGIRHECNTFGPLPTTLEDFVVARSKQALKEKKWAEFLRQAGVEIVPSLYAYAWPGGMITRSRYEELKEEILAGAKKAGRVDGVFLDLHGAMHVEGYDDAQVMPATLSLTALEDCHDQENLVDGPSLARPVGPYGLFTRRAGDPVDRQNLGGAAGHPHL